MNNLTFLAESAMDSRYEPIFYGNLIGCIHNLNDSEIIDGEEVLESLLKFDGEMNFREDGYFPGSASPETIIRSFAAKILEKQFPGKYHELYKKLMIDLPSCRLRGTLKSIVGDE